MMSMGCVMMDLEGTELQAEERELLKHPAVGGVIYFTRNFESVEQITALSVAVREAAGKPILISVDHEGGRVQRFREGFTRLPPIASLGQNYTDDPVRARQAAHKAGWLMAAEVRAVGIDWILIMATVMSLVTGLFIVMPGLFQYWLRRISRGCVRRVWRLPASIFRVMVG